MSRRPIKDIVKELRLQGIAPNIALEEAANIRNFVQVTTNPSPNLSNKDSRTTYHLTGYTDVFQINSTQNPSSQNSNSQAQR